VKSDSTAAVDRQLLPVLYDVRYNILLYHVLFGVGLCDFGFCTLSK